MPPSNPEHRKNQPGYAITGFDVADALKLGRYMLIDRPNYQPHMLNYGTQAAPVSLPTLPAAADAADTLTSLYVPGAIGHQYIEIYATTAQAIRPLVHASKGLEIAGDQVNNESVEYVPGGNRASNPLGYQAPNPSAGVVGNGAAFIKATLEIEDADGSDQLVIGYRKLQNYVVPTGFLAATDPLYTDFAAIGFAGAVTNPNQVRTITDLNDQGAVPTVHATNFTIADGGIHTFEVRIIGRRVLYYLNGQLVGGRIAIDGLGAAITAQNTFTPPAYTVDAGDFMVPFIFVRQDAALTLVYIRRLEVGLLVNAGLDNNNREI